MLFFTILLAIIVLVKTDTATNNPGKFVGGVDADISEYPHQISLRRYGQHFCGGSIYKSNIIITAAHCIERRYPSKLLTIAAGVTSLSEESEEVEVRHILIHENYMLEGRYDYDIALLVLHKHLEFNSKVQPIRVAQFYSYDPQVTVTGWGDIGENGTTSDHLQKLELNVINRKECENLYKNRFKVTNRMLCAAAEAGVKDACQGDSGGPLVLGDELLGVVSWGWDGCARADSPGVYVSVPQIHEWIIAKSNLISESEP